MLTAAGCRVEVTVGVDVDNDGSGKVRVEVVVDRDVTDRIDLRTGLKTEDLARAGWVVAGPTPIDDGRTRVTATKAFDDAAGLEQAMGEVSGPEGPFRAFRLSQQSGWFRTTTRFTGTVDFAKGVEAFGDPALRRQLGGDSDIGIDIPALEEAVGEPIDRAVQIAVAVRLPGSVESNAPSTAENGARWQIPLRQSADLRAESKAWRLGPIVVVAAVVALVVLAPVALFWRRRRRPS